MPPKKRALVKVEFYFLNGAGKDFLLDPKVDELDEKGPKHIVIKRANPKQVVRIAREFIAYYVATNILVDVEAPNTLSALTTPEPELELL